MYKHSVIPSNWCRLGVAASLKYCVFKPETRAYVARGALQTGPQLFQFIPLSLPKTQLYIKSIGIVLPRRGIKFPCPVSPRCRPEFFLYVWDMLTIVPIFQKQARQFIAKHHRHHKPSVGSVFNIAVSDGEKIVGVCMVGRPVARMLNDGLTLEVTRLCTDGTRNACSILYAAAWRVSKNLGYKRLITYILETESGVTLRAAGFREIGLSGGGKWSRPSRERARTATEQLKIRYEKAA